MCGLNHEITANETVFSGLPIAPGVAHGPVCLLGQSDFSIPETHISEGEIAKNVQRFQDALVRTRKDVIEVRDKVSAAIGDENGRIFDAHLLVLEDQALLDNVIRNISENHMNVEWAFRSAADKYIQVLAGIDDEYLQERAADMKDVTDRLQRRILGVEEDTLNLNSLSEPSILVGHDIAPSMTALIDKELIAGLITEIGSKTSHTAILARSLKIPALAGVPAICEKVRNGQTAIIDGFDGLFISNPTPQTLFEYGQVVQKKSHAMGPIFAERALPSEMLDGTPVTISANIEQPDNIEEVKDSGAQGIGLFRTEFLFISKDRLPTEEEQFEAYDKVASSMAPQPVVIRTLDIGGDKIMSKVDHAPELNPFLGMRAIRFCLQEIHIFKAQLRAILRASVHGNVKLMYPLISCASEISEANSLLEQCKDELRKEGVEFDDELRIGAMIETPSAAVTSDILARHVSFFSIGTNDLIQYSMAVDRLNEKIAYLYKPAHPAILRLIHRTVSNASHQGIKVSVCGEMASELIYVPILLALGVEELSVTPPLVPEVKYLIRHLDKKALKPLASLAMDFTNDGDLMEKSLELLHSRVPSLMSSE